MEMVNDLKRVPCEGPVRSLREKLPMEENSNDVTGKPVGEAGGDAEEYMRSSTSICGTFTSKSRPLFLKFFSRWLSSFSLSAMLAILVKVNAVLLVDLACELPFSTSLFSASS